jgi:hypothetical protein
VRPIRAWCVMRTEELESPVDQMEALSHC